MTTEQNNLETVEQLWKDAVAARQNGQFDDARAAAGKLVALLEHGEPTQAPHYGHGVGLLYSIERAAGAAEADSVIAQAIDRLSDDAFLDRSHLEVVQAVALWESDRLAEAAQLLHWAVDRAGLGLSADRERGLDVLSDAIRVGQRLFDESPAGESEARRTLAQAAEAAVALLHESDPLLLRADATRWVAQLLNDQRRYDEALVHHEFTVAAAEWRAGHQSPEYGAALAGYGLALDQTGNWRLAERAYRAAQTIFEQELGPFYFETITMRFNIAELARIRGDFEYAERELRAITEIDAKLNPEVDQRSTKWMLHLGLTLAGTRNFAEAETVLEEARRLRLQTFGPDSPVYARVLLALAQLHQAQQHDQQAIERYDQVVAILAEQPEWWRTRQDAAFERSLSQLHTAADPATALADIRALLVEADMTREPDHPENALRRWTLITHLARAGLKQALWEEIPAAQVSALSHLSDTLRSGNAAAATEALARYHVTQRLALRLLMGRPHTADDVAHSYGMTRRVRGIQTQLLRSRSLRSAADTADLRNDIGQARYDITQLRLRLAAGTATPATDAQLADAENRLAAAQYELAQATDDVGGLPTDLFGTELPPLTIPDGTAVVMYALAGQFDGTDSRYVAFVARVGHAPVELVDLAEVDIVNRLVQQFRDAVASQGRVPRPSIDDWLIPGLELTRLLIDPLREQLGASDRIWIMPEDQVGVLPFAVLPRAGGGFLLDEFTIGYRVSVGIADDVTSDAGPASPPSVLGAPDYSTTSGPGSLNPDETEDSNFLAFFRSGARFEPLPGAVEECRGIAGLLSVQPVLGRAATERAVFTLHSPETLHIATHGFFLNTAESTPGAAQDSLAARRLLKDSLDRCGLAFSGANNYLDGRPLPQGAEDGILYASEVAGLDLKGTELVSLSACQTGLGDVQPGDGVQGLQRAFLSAGARSVVCSLWEVPDRPTQRLFLGFYRRIMRGEPRGAALRETMRELAADYPDRPVAWGGFVLYGDEGVLSRFQTSSPRLAVSRSSADDTDDDPDAYASPAQRAEAALVRARSEHELGDDVAAEATFTAVIQESDLPPPLLARARFERAQLYRQLGRTDSAVAAYQVLLHDDAVGPILRQNTQFDLGTTYLRAQRFDEAVEVYSAYLTEPWLDDNRRAMALVNRGWAYLLWGRDADARLDFDEVVESAMMPAAQRAKALVARARLSLNAGDLLAARRDADAVIEGVGAEPDNLAGAYQVRGAVSRGEGRLSWRNDFEAAMAVRGISADRRAVILNVLADQGP